MHLVDYIIFAVYFLGILYVGFYFYRKNKDREDYYVGGRDMSPSHLGLSIVATDVGGGFSIGLGGLGYVMGLSGSWLLFTGLVGAWLAAVILVPRVKKIDVEFGMLTFPDFLRKFYGNKVALAAAVISGIGYLGFTGGQILAGAKLAAGSVFSRIEFMEPFDLSLYAMASIVLIYTVAGGLKAVIYTDTIQWIILLFGLLFFGVPFAYYEAGGIDALTNVLPESYFTLTNVTFVQIVNWASTIIPIWFIAMTLYQRIYASRNVKEAKKAFYIAGILEYPFMAFIGVTLGMISRVFFPDVDAEMGLPLLLRDVLPIGITGIVAAAYFSAIMSTADSCLIASSGNFVNDIIERYFMKNTSDKKVMKVSQVVTFLIGGLALLIAGSFTSVLDIILQAYSFMVAGLLVPTLAAVIFNNDNPYAALAGMISGGTVSMLIIFGGFAMPFGFDSSVYGILTSLIVFTITNSVTQKEKKNV